MTAPRRALEAIDDPTPTDLAGEPVIPAHGLLEEEPRPARRVVAPLALVTALAAVFGTAMLWPRPDAQQVTDVTVAARPVVADDVLSRNGHRSAVTASPSARPSASPTPSALPRPRVTPTPKRAPSPRALLKATPTPTPRASASPTPTPAVRPSVPPRAEVVGSRWATTALNVRLLPSSESRRVAGLVEGERAKVTSARDGVWRQVVVDGRTGWVLADRLTRTEPTRQEPSTSSSGDGSSSSSSSPSASRASASGAACRSHAVEQGLVANAVALHRAACAAFPAVTGYGGVRPTADAHGTGHALDIMVSGEEGWAVARWARENSGRLGITEVIYAQQIWTTQRAGEGWRPMSDRGSATANHHDHVHVTVR